MLRGEYVILRTPEMDDAGIMTAWQNDREVTKFLPFIYPVSTRDQEEMIKHSGEKNSFTFIIETEDEIPIGLCLLKNIDWNNSTAEISVVIYAKNCWGRGYGFDAVKTLTDFALDDINVYTLYVNILAGNEMAVKCFQKAGYEIEGVLFSRLFKDGMHKDIISMSISKGRRQEE